MTATSEDQSKQDAVPEKAPENKKTPRPVPSLTAPELDSAKQHDNSGQSIIPTAVNTTHKTDQIDTGELSPNIFSKSPVSPTSDEKENVEKVDEKKELPPLPFSGETDLMAKVAKPTPQSGASAKALPGKVGAPSGGVPAIRSDKDLDSQMSKAKTDKWLQTQGKDYMVHGISRPDAASIQGAANRQKVCTEILRAEQTKEYAEVITRTHYLGQYVDTVVHHDFDNSRQMLLLEMAAKHPETVNNFTAEGLPVFKPGATFMDKAGKEKNLMLTVMHTLLADIQFSIRDATTKASTSGIRKILNQEWRDDVELESELHEIALVDTVKANK